MAEVSQIPKRAVVLMIVTVGYILLGHIAAGFSHFFFSKDDCLFDARLFITLYLMPPLFLILVMLAYAVISLIRLRIRQMAVLSGVAILSVFLLGIGKELYYCVVMSV